MNIDDSFFCYYSLCSLVSISSCLKMFIFEMENGEQWENPQQNSAPPRQFNISLKTNLFRNIISLKHLW